MRKCATSIVALLVLSTSANGIAQNTITIEAIDTYPGCGPLNNNVANVDNFRSRMVTAPVVPFADGLRWVHTDVFASDFRDPQTFFGGDDTNNFDRSVDVISYFSGHGTCDDQDDDPNRFCVTDGDCPLVGGVNRQCLRWTENFLFPLGKCAWSRPRNIVMADCTEVTYSQNGVKIGESSNSGNFAGAGTNGGVNFTVIDNSCGLTPLFPGEQLGTMFAGVHVVGLIMPTRVGDDTADVANRGRAWADRFFANHLASASVSWVSSINQVTGGAACEFGGGSHGIVGCGAHITVAMGANHTQTSASHAESFLAIKSNATDATSNAWVQWVWECNYDCDAHPWEL